MVVLGDNLGPNGTDRVAVQPQVFYPGTWSAATAYDNAVAWTSDATTELTLKVSGTTVVKTPLGDFAAWVAPTGSIESSGVVNAGIDYWTPQLGAPVAFDTMTTLPEGSANHIIRTLIATSQIPIPEPGSVALLSCGLAGLAAWRRLACLQSPSARRWDRAA